jgi:protein transport protein SEC61 subunit gamma-like protein
MKINEILTKIKSFFIQCKRVWMVLKKPTKKEFTNIAKIAGIGILIIGFLGFLIALIMKIFG